MSLDDQTEDLITSRRNPLVRRLRRHAEPDRARVHRRRRGGDAALVGAGRGPGAGHDADDEAVETISVGSKSGSGSGIFINLGPPLVLKGIWIRL